MTVQTQIVLPTAYVLMAPEDLTHEQCTEVWKLPGREGINILRDRELQMAVVRDDGYPVGGLWSSWADNQFTFDVVVSLLARGKGIAKALVQHAIDTYNQEREAYDSPRLVVNVVSHAMRRLLQDHFGFEVIPDKSNQNWTMLPTVDEWGRVLTE